MKRLVLCPLKLERQYLVDELEKLGADFGLKSFGNKTLPYAVDRDCAFALGGHGKVNFALRAQEWILKYPDLQEIIAIGACGGISNEAKVFDVILSEFIIEHDYNELFSTNSKKPRFVCKVPQNIPKVESFTLHLAGIASGDEDIISIERAQQLQKETLAHGVCWESAGGIRAAKSHNVNYYELRGVSDSACSEASQDFIKNLPQSMRNCANVLWQILQLNP